MFCFDIHALSIICTKPLGLELRISCEAIIALLPLPSGSSGFVRGLGVLSNMTTALNVAFEFPAHVVGNFKFKYLPSLLWELLAFTIGQVCGLFHHLLCTYIALGFFLSLVPTIFLQSFSR